MGRAGSTSLAAAAAPAWRRLPLARSGMLGQTAGTVGLNVAMTALGFAGTVALTHALGADGFGAYAFGLAWATLLTVPATLGMAPLVVRHVAAYRERGAWGELRGILRRSSQTAALIAVLVSVVAAGVGALALGEGSELRAPLLTGMLLVPVLAIVTMRQAAMQGLGRVVVGRAPETLVAPGLFLLLVLVVPAATGSDPTPAGAMAFQVAAAVCALALGAWLLRRAMPLAARAAPPAYETRAWIGSGLPLLGASLVMAVNTQLGTILVGAFSGSAETGVFSAATRAAMFAGFLFAAASYPLMPAAARLHAAGRTAELERLLTRAGRGVALASLPLVVAFVALAPDVLRVFGEEFGGGGGSLRLLVAAQAVTMVCGFAGLVLLMTGHERSWGTWVVAGGAANLAAGLVLVPPLGAEGAAIAALLSVLVTSVPMVAAARRRLAVWTPVLPLPRR